MGTWSDFGVAAGSDVLGTALGLVTQNLSNRNTYKWGEKAAESDFNRQMQLYERQYKDKSPLNVVNQLKEAGLNKGLMFSGGAGGVGGAASGTTAGTNKMGGAQLQQQQNLAVTMAQIENLKSQTADNQASARLKDSQIPETNERINLMKAQQDEIIATISNKEAQTNLINLQSEYQTTLNSIQNSTKETVIQTATQNLNNLIKSTDEIISRTNLNEAETEKINKLLDSQLAEIIASAKLKNAGVRLSNLEWTNLWGEIKNLLPDLKNRNLTADAAKKQAETAAQNLQFSKDKFPYEFGESIFRDIIMGIGMVIGLRKGSANNGFTEEIIERTSKTGMYGDGTKKETIRTHKPNK